MITRILYYHNPHFGGGSGHGKPKLTVKHGKESGSVVLRAPIENGRVCYEWQISKDGINWQPLTITIRATLLVKDLTPGERVYFRYRVIRKGGADSWN